MKRFVTIAVLMAALCGQTLAGEIPSGGFPSPSQTGTNLGEIPSVGIAKRLSSEALSAFLSVLGLLAG